jgi:hypothetical protein
VLVAVACRLATAAFGNSRTYWRNEALTRRATRWGLEAIIATINPILRGWYGYFKQASADALLPLSALALASA